MRGGGVNNQWIRIIYVSYLIKIVSIFQLHVLKLHTQICVCVNGSSMVFLIFLYVRVLVFVWNEFIIGWCSPFTQMQFMLHILDYPVYSILHVSPHQIEMQLIKLTDWCIVWCYNDELCHNLRVFLYQYRCMAWKLLASTMPYDWLFNRFFFAFVHHSCH